MNPISYLGRSGVDGAALLEGPVQGQHVNFTYLGQITLRDIYYAKYYGCGGGGWMAAGEKL